MHTRAHGSFVTFLFLREAVQELVEHVVVPLAWVLPDDAVLKRKRTL